MLPALIALLAAVGPLLNGSWDLWAQSILLFVLIAGSAAWLCARTAVGYLPLPSTRTLLWAGGLAALSCLSAYASPLSAYAVPAWRALLPALWIFAAIAAVSKDERSHVDEAIRAAGWVLVLLAFYQKLHYGVDRPYASLLNQNVFAGMILMLLPLAVQKRDWVLAAGLLLCLWWSKSVGAWLGLAAALASTRKSGQGGFWGGASIGFVCLVALYGKLQSPEVLDRVHWWQAALRMAMDRPLLGFGPGAYAYAQAAFEGPGRRLGSLFAHHHLLETASECGLPYAALWLFGVLHWIRRGGPHKRFGAVAVLVQSLWDYALSIPALLWLFSYFTASSIPESSRGVNIPMRWKLPLCVAILAAAGAGGYCVARQWQADRLRAQAESLLFEGSIGGVRSPHGAVPAALAEEALRLLDDSQTLAEHPQAARLAAELELRLARGQADAAASGRVLAAAEHLERSARLDPYRVTTWLALEDLYARLGRPDLAAGARRSCGSVCEGKTP